MSLFFAYTKPKPSASDTLNRVFGYTSLGHTDTCDKCGAVLLPGDWPFCSGHRPKNRGEDE